MDLKVGRKILTRGTGDLITEFLRGGGDKTCLAAKKVIPKPTFDVIKDRIAASSR
ncbi:MAG: hypothetical protein VST68_01470 [Nitrospirota bacterium]|nr:hypothetical protein [Nitrospirota bacterium]